MIEPNEHGLTLVDWCYSCGGPNPGNLPAAVASYRDWYPPELGPATRPALTSTSTWPPRRCWR